MFKVSLILAICTSVSACVVVPESVNEKNKYKCELSTNKKTLKLTNLTEGDTSFYRWNDELTAFITIPTSAVISATYVLVNNIYHIGEKQIKCADKPKLDATS